MSTLFDGHIVSKSLMFSDDISVVKQHMTVHIAAVFASHTSEATQMSINRKVDKQIVVQSCNNIL